MDQLRRRPTFPSRRLVSLRIDPFALSSRDGSTLTLSGSAFIFLLSVLSFVLARGSRMNVVMFVRWYERRGWRRRWVLRFGEDRGCCGRGKERIPRRFSVFPLFWKKNVKNRFVKNRDTLEILQFFQFHKIIESKWKKCQANLSNSLS